MFEPHFFGCQKKVTSFWVSAAVSPVRVPAIGFADDPTNPRTSEVGFSVQAYILSYSQASFTAPERDPVDPSLILRRHIWELHWDKTWMVVDTSLVPARVSRLWKDRFPRVSSVCMRRTRDTRYVNIYISCALHRSVLNGHWVLVNVIGICRTTLSADRLVLYRNQSKLVIIRLSIRLRLIRIPSDLIRRDPRKGTNLIGFQRRQYKSHACLRWVASSFATVLSYLSKLPFPPVFFIPCAFPPPSPIYLLYATNFPYVSLRHAFCLLLWIIKDPPHIRSKCTQTPAPGVRTSWYFSTATWGPGQQECRC